MKLLHKFAIGIGLLFTDIVLLCCCLYMTVIADKMEALQPNYLLWISLVAICFMVNLALVKKSKSLGALLTWNLIWMVVTSITVSMTFQSTPSSIPLKIFICGVIIAIEGHSIALSLLSQKASTQLTFLDVSIVVFAIFLAGCHFKELQNVLALQLLGFICVGYTLISLIVLRTCEEGVSIVRGTSISSRVKVFGLLAIIVSVSCATCGVLTAVAKKAGSNLIDIMQFLFQSLKATLTKAGKLLQNLFSKLPQSHLEEDPVSGNYSGYPAAEESGLEAVMRLPEWLLPLVGVLLAAIIIFFLVRLIHRLRKEKVHLDTTSLLVKPTVVTIRKKAAPTFFQRFRKKLALWRKMYHGRHTPEGLAILIRKSGKKIGITMQPNESWHSYTVRLIPYGDAAALTDLATYMEQYFYSGQHTLLSQEKYHFYATCLKQLKKDEQ